MRNSINRAKAVKYGAGIAVNAARWACFLLIAFVVLYPLFTQIVSVFMSADDIYNMSVRYIPRNFTFKNLINAWDRIGLEKVYPTTIQYTVTVVLLEVASCTMVGYSLARFKFALNKPLTVLCIIGLALPPDLLQIPLYNLFRNFNLFGLIPLINNGEPLNFIDTQIPGIVLGALAVGLRCGLYILIMRQFFGGMPKEMEEAASIDGCGPIGVFLKIMLPGARTMMITIGLFAFVWTWTDCNFNYNFMRLSDILAVVLRDFNGNAADSMIADQVTMNLQSYAAILYLVIPLIILYMFTQRFFVESVERSGLVA